MKERIQERWPDIPYGPWRDTCSALHLYSQIIGKYRLARTPWPNHSWHATLYLNARGFTTGLVPDGPGGIELSFDLIDHQLVGMATNGRTLDFRSGRCRSQPSMVARWTLFKNSAEHQNCNGRPNEILNAIPFVEDRAERPYDADAVNRFFRASVVVASVFQTFRTGYLGKVSPVHLFWGSFDLAVTRFSGRPAPLHPGGIPSLPDEVTREAYSHEVSSAGFWPGGGAVDFPAFYSYAYPTPVGFAGARILPDAAYWDKNLGEFLLPYDAVRRSADPDASLIGFLESTYRAAADLAGFDAALECAIGQPRRPRPL